MVSTVLFTPALLALALTQPFGLWLLAPLYAATLLVGYAVGGRKISFLHPALNDLNHNFLQQLNKLDPEQRESVINSLKYLAKYLAHSKERDKDEIAVLMDMANKLKLG